MCSAKESCTLDLKDLPIQEEEAAAALPPEDVMAGGEESEAPRHISMAYWLYVFRAARCT